MDLRFPLYLSMPLMAVPLVASLFLKEPRTTSRYEVKKQLAVLKKGMMFAIQKPEVRWVIGFCALIMGASKIWFFTYNPYFERVGISLRYYGLIFFLLNVVAFFFSHYADWIGKRFAEGFCVKAMILLVGVPILLMSALPYWPLAYLVLLQNVVRGFARPFVGNFTNRHIDSEEIRATALSARSTLTDLVSVLSLAWFGLMDKSLGLLPSLAVLGVVVLVLGKWSYGSYQRLFAKGR
jgi:hypothetical protein